MSRPCEEDKNNLKVVYDWMVLVRVNHLSPQMLVPFKGVLLYELGKIYVLSVRYVYVYVKMKPVLCFKT